MSVELSEEIRARLRALGVPDAVISAPVIPQRKAPPAAPIATPAPVQVIQAPAIDAAPAPVPMKAPRARARKTQAPAIGVYSVSEHGLTPIAAPAIDAAPPAPVPAIDAAPALAPVPFTCPAETELLTLTERLARGLKPEPKPKYQKGALYRYVLVTFDNGFQALAGMYPRAKNPDSIVPAIASARARLLLILSGGRFIDAGAAPKLPAITGARIVSDQKEREYLRGFCQTLRAQLEKREGARALYGDSEQHARDIAAGEAMRAGPGYSHLKPKKRRAA